MEHPLMTGFDPRIEALRTKPDGAEVVSVRFSGADLGIWNKLRGAHPKLSATEVLKEAMKLRYLADLCSADGTGLFLQQPGTGQLQEVLSLLGYSRASLVEDRIEEEHPGATQAAPKATVSKTRKPAGAHRQKMGKKTATNQGRQTTVMT